MGKNGAERVKYAIHRLSYYLYNQYREGFEFVDRDTQRMWFDWVSLQDRRNVDTWTIRFALGMPEEVVDLEQKMTLVKYLYDSASDFVWPINLKNGDKVDVFLAEDEVKVLVSIMKDVTTSQEVRDEIVEYIIQPFLQSFSLDHFEEEDVDDWSLTTLDQAKKLLEKLRHLIDQ